MAYIFRGKLCGLICPECPESLANVTVRLYRSRNVQTVVALTVTSPKEPFVILTEEQVKEKSSALIAETNTDEEGNFTFELGDNERYNGEMFEVNVYCTTVPRLKPSSQIPTPMQFSITTLQPRWRQTEKGFVSVWNYCLPHRFWCLVRGRFGAWTIYGRVTHCATGAPIPNVRVRGFDVDWLQDDDLGSAITDTNGKFRIDYLASDFQQTIFSSFQLEWVGGPDLYFKVETLSGTPLLTELPSRGRDPDRENAGPCFCVSLCLEEQPEPQTEPLPVFTKLGGYKYASQIHSSVPGTGLTVGDNRAFYSTVRLNGILSKKLNGQPMEYRFEVRVTDATGGSPGPWMAIPMFQIARTVIGDLETYAPDFPGDPNPIKTKDYTVNGVAGPDELVASVTPDGWIQVPQESDVFSPSGYFQPNGNMINLITPMLAVFGTKDMTGVLAGNSSTSNGATLAANHHFSLRMRVRQAGNPATEITAGFCPHVAINNTGYDNVKHHPSWAGFTDPPKTIGVRLLDIQQLITNGCVEITNALDVLFTATHPDLGSVSVTMSGPGGPYNFTLPAAVPGERFGTATPSGWTVASLQPCAYIVRLSVQLLLTTGDSIPDNLYDDIAFCKS
ncbi:MAG: carboxypeptidase-like regulatory domain-containing protein [Candidatus Jettenia sp. CY-1]|nr:MAG: carboxypeptidase-like regulatory domain-containing protein [Candidatus Jettenia sp. CY-1]